MVSMVLSYLVSRTHTAIKISKARSYQKRIAVTTENTWKEFIEY